jgi:hypothetical protein
MLKLQKLPLFLLLFLPLPLLLAFHPSPCLPQADLPVYTDALEAGWQDWSWNITVDYANPSPVQSGAASLAVTFNQGWDGLQFGYHGAQLDVSAYDTLRFYIHGGASGGQQVTLVIGSIEQVITPAVNTWTQVDVSLLPLGTPRNIGTIWWWNDTANPQSIFYLDDIVFVNSGLPTPTPPAPGQGPALSVDAASDQHTISPYIYGMNFASEELAADLDLPVRRWGGNSTSRYNWQNDTTNTGSDWYFENVPEETNAAGLFINQDRRTGTKTLMTVPLIGWVAKRRPAGHPYDCGFSIAKYGAQQDADWSWDPDCGNGVRTNGTPITGNDPTDTSVAISSSFVADWVDHLAAVYGAADQGGVLFYDLDNEPMLWNSTHRDVHPEPTSYDELRDQTWDYAAAIKTSDPSAQTLGPVVWGWCAYFYSAADGCGPGSDYQSHGNTYFVEWYLQQMKAYQDAHSVRILDYLDVHYYPQAEGVALSSAGSTTTQALRLRSTRSLWDPTYEDESWIADVAEGPYVRLIPRMKEWVAANYPGTKLAITEYNWGALDHINGALAQADVLGIFGRERLDLATLWGPPDAGEPGAFAFRMYRNYDGAGSAFGETSVHAASGDQEQLAIYAARRISDDALTLIVINKTAAALTSDLSLSNFAPAAWAQVYRYSALNLAAIVQAADQAVTAAGFTASFPANSITLIVIPPAGPPPPPVMYLPMIVADP